jgi:polysaccharide export outer membrane protein
VFRPIVCLLISVLTCPGQQSIGVRGSYHCGPGDLLDIRFFEVEDLDTQAPISAAGQISLPLVGAVSVGGLTTAEIEDRLEAMYREDVIKEPQISVSVAEFQSQPVTVIGAVREPGAYQLRGERRLLELLAMAGGLDEEVGGGIKLQRGSDEVITVSIGELLARPGPLTNILIKPHDIVEVERAGVVYVVGAVEKAGGFPVRDQRPMTVLRALSLAQGLSQFSSPQNAMVIRDLGAERREIPVALKDILRGRGEDVVLEMDDILWVPDSRAKSVLNRGVEAAIQMATGIVVWRR